MRIVYVVAVSEEEAESLAEEHGHETHAAALSHLAAVKAPPTDSFYASQYKIFPVDLDHTKPAA